MKNDFMIKNADGTTTPIVMTLGDLSDNHHGTCYRLYNLWRESKSHKYPSGARPAELSPAWADVQAHATELMNAAASAGL